MNLPHKVRKTFSNPRHNIPFPSYSELNQPKSKFIMHFSFYWDKRHFERCSKIKKPDFHQRNGFSSSSANHIVCFFFYWFNKKNVSLYFFKLQNFSSYIEINSIYSHELTLPQENNNNVKKWLALWGIFWLIFLLRCRSVILSGGVSLWGVNHFPLCRLSVASLSTTYPRA